MWSGDCGWDYVTNVTVHRGKGCVASDDHGSFLKWPWPAYFLGGRYDFSTGVTGWDGTGSLTSGDSDSPTVVRPLDCGALIVVGMESKNWQGEMRFSIGLLKSMDFTPPADFNSTGERGALNSGIDLLVGYKF
jgi:hypothetical protein